MDSPAASPQTTRNSGSRLPSVPGLDRLGLGGARVPKLAASLRAQACPPLRPLALAGRLDREGRDHRGLTLQARRAVRAAPLLQHLSVASAPARVVNRL